MPQYETKDSGVRHDYASGMVRDTQQGKPRFALYLAEGMPYEDQFLTRIAALAGRGADKYGARNHELANSEDEVARFKESALRHMMQWLCGETDEDHAAAVAFNLFMHESCVWRIENARSSTGEGDPGLRA